MEMSRLSLLNSRTLCITFPSISGQHSMPSYSTLMSLTNSIQSLVLARRSMPWCFMIFPTKGLKMEAEMQLDNKKCGQDMMVVDKTKMLIPVQADDLEQTRDGHSLQFMVLPTILLKIISSLSFPGPSKSLLPGEGAVPS